MYVTRQGIKTRQPLSELIVSLDREFEVAPMKISLKMKLTLKRLLCKILTVAL